MITTPQEYYSHLVAIQNKHFPFSSVPIALIPNRENVYDIDLNTRKINSPEFIGVEEDQAAETIYFRVDRYYDYVDLKDMICIIQYTNAKGSTKLYPVPFYDISTYAKDKKMLIPWNVGTGATIVAGNVEYIIKFYRLDATGEKFEYNLNTLPAITKVLKGIKSDKASEDEGVLDPTQFEILVSRIEQIDRQDLYWTDLY